MRDSVKFFAELNFTVNPPKPRIFPPLFGIFLFTQQDVVLFYKQVNVSELGLVTQGGKVVWGKHVLLFLLCGLFFGPIGVVCHEKR